MTGGSRQPKAPIHAALGLLVGALVALQLSDPEPGLLYLAPALLLLAGLAFDRYPGARLLEAVVQARIPVLRAERRAAARPSFPPCIFPRGGVLLALALAGRGPPS